MQKRYQELTGWASPHAEGSKYKELTYEQKEIDRKVRLTLSKELGHERLDMIANHCGK